MRADVDPSRSAGRDPKRGNVGDRGPGAGGVRGLVAGGASAVVASDDRGSGSTVDLALKDVTKAFGAFIAVNQVSLEVARGQRCALLGPNGAGKTTLLNLINGRLGCTAGSILIRGHDVTRRSAAARSRYGVGRSFQRTNVFPGLSLLANVRLGLMARGQGLATWNPWRSIAADRALNDAALRLLGRVNLKRDPDERADALSYGEQRQLELAITLATEPDIVLLDEPTAGMSPSETAAIIELLVELLEDRTVVIVEHDLSVVDRIAERIVVLERGRVIADGAPAEVKADPAVQRAYLKGDHRDDHRSGDLRADGHRADDTRAHRDGVRDA